MTEQEEKILDEFYALKADLEKWGAQVDHRLMTILQDLDIANKIKLFPKFRLKDQYSFLSKSMYREKQYSNPIIDIEDKVGTRVVLLKSSDVYEASDLIRNCLDWNIKVTKNIKELIDEKPTGFEYQSVHFVAWPKDQAEYENDISKLTCEIQLRTILQHAFAEISHDSTYKGPYKNDKEIIRQLSKSMALMEVTDDYFVQIFHLMSDENRRYSNFYKELVRLYQKINGRSVDRANKDLELVDVIFGLLAESEVSISAVEEFTHKRMTELKEAIKFSNLYLFSQPIIILVAYFIFNKPTWLREKWPLSSDILNSALNSFGISSNDY